MSLNFFHYLSKFSYNALPSLYFKRNYKRLRAFEKHCDSAEIKARVSYYCKAKPGFKIPQEAVAVKDYSRQGKSNYYLDLKEFLHYFAPHVRFAYHFGDETHVNTYPTLFKARPIGESSANSVLFKLNKRRHFKWVDDPYTFSQKKDMLVWRGGVYQPLRKAFVRQFWNQPLCDVGQTNRPPEDVAWEKSRLTIEEQLGYKFIFCPEGNDVATNLKWAMSSNSLCIMPKPKYETWFMEGSLQAGVHYVAVRDDFSDLIDQVKHYTTHIAEAEQIIANAHQHVARFRNDDLEDLLCLKVLEAYAEASGQVDVLRFEEKTRLNSTPHQNKHLL